MRLLDFGTVKDGEFKVHCIWDIAFDGPFSVKITEQNIIMGNILLRLASVALDGDR